MQRTKTEKVKNGGFPSICSIMMCVGGETGVVGNWG